jgi:hypothetical protein
MEKSSLCVTALQMRTQKRVANVSKADSGAEESSANPGIFWPVRLSPFDRALVAALKRRFLAWKARR